MEIDRDETLKTLNEIVELELAVSCASPSTRSWCSGTHESRLWAGCASRRSSRWPTPFRPAKKSRARGQRVAEYR